MAHSSGMNAWIPISGALGMAAVAASGLAWHLRKQASIAHAQRQALEQELDQARAEQSEAQLARSRFLGAASHDLRQPVHALLLLTDIFKRSGDATKQKEIAQQMVRTTESIDGMFKGLVDLAQIDAGKVQVRMTAVDLRQLLATATAGFDEKCSIKGLTFDMRDVPAVHVLTDAVLLERIVRNLLDNAHKYSAEGRITVRAVAHPAAKPTAVRLQIRDQGLGMTADELAQAFEPFYRAASASQSEAPGIGLGLAVCHSTALLMGTTLELQSEVGKGTQAELLLDVAEVKASSFTSTLPVNNLMGLRVALLEDDALARDAMCLWLREAGAHVVAAPTLLALRQALTHEKDNPNFIVADHQLADQVNGIAAIAALRERFGELPALIVSGDANLDLSLPKLAYLQKPVQPKQLQRAISQHR
jgi:signal transduction histidine kinase